MDIGRLQELDERALSTVRDLPKRRFLFHQLARQPGRPFRAVVGPRGAGKTVLLRQLRAEADDAFYLSADTLAPEASLTEIVRLLHDSYGIRRVFVDEIHFIDQFPRVLKELYDFYEVEIWFTSSSALALHESAWDLSRRVLRVFLGPFSYREYLSFRYDKSLRSLPLEEALSKPIPTEHLRAGAWFEEYLRGGLYPFTLEAPGRIELFESMLEKVLTTDLIASDPSLSAIELDQMRKMIAFIGRSPVDGINYSTVAANLGVTKYKAQKQMELLERSFLLYRVFPHGTNVLKEPKVFLELPYRLAFRSYQESLGAIREEYTTLALRQHGVGFEYAKSTRGAKTPDFVLSLRESKLVLEVGGKGKGRSQFKSLDYDRKVVAYQSDDRLPDPGRSVPLHTLGFPELS
ncbi:MAG: ATP-binding protein [Alkalispirochaetaceae bacterium]